MDQIKIGTFLRQLRKENGLTQEQLAEKLGVTNRSVSRWENGVNMPDFDLVIEIADLFDITIDEFLYGERKIDMIDKNTEETMLNVADYTVDDNMALVRRLCGVFTGGVAAFIVYIIIQLRGLAYAGVYDMIASFVLGFAFGTLIVGAAVTGVYTAKICTFKKRLLRRRRG